MGDYNSDSGDLATMIMTSSSISEALVEEVSMKVVASSPETSGLLGSILISNNNVEISAFDKTIHDGNLLSDLSFQNEDITFENTVLNDLSITSSAIQGNPTTANALGSDENPNTNTLLPFIHTTANVSYTENAMKTRYGDIQGPNTALVRIGKDIRGIHDAKETITELDGYMYVIAGQDYTFRTESLSDWFTWEDPQHRAQLHRQQEVMWTQYQQHRKKLLEHIETLPTHHQFLKENIYGDKKD